MRKSLLLVSIFVATTTTVGVTYAGMEISREVNINYTTSSASGSVRDAHDSADPWQFIGCRVTGTSTAPQINCQAYNSALETAACTSNIPAHVQAATGINDLSQITFSWSGGSCSSFGVNNYSYYLN